ncbi:tRNA endonuclease ANKZF1-like isoform X1 [Amphiura filiformis]|uniref:tRNA endonuclease ANKZF1-like isoform X1 n=1 Tax=Amphiura filiformis TaxID=82378 RepID=UPI003B213085
MENTPQEGPVESHIEGENSTRDDTKSKTAKEFKVESFNLYEDKAASLLHGLTLSSCQPDTSLADLQMSSEPVSLVEQDVSQVYTISNKMMCSLCDCKFDNREQQTEHYKLDWHRFNLKERMIGAESVTMEAFEAMSGDISSISGSDSNTSDSDNEDYQSPYSDHSKIDMLKNQTKSTNSDDDDNTKAKQRNYPKVFFTNSQGQLISVHRCILHGKKNVPSSQSELISMASKLTSNPKWAIIMTGGGHFAGAVFHGNEMAVHKTFHRYTVRAKRGTAQGQRDGKQGGNQPKSAGASIRRYNEAALMQDIQDLLESWKETLNDCQLIFLRAPSYNRNIFYGGKNPAFTKDDTRMSFIPFPTRRSTLKEIRRIHEVLSSVQCYGDATEAEAHLNKMFLNQTTDKSSSKTSDDTKKAYKNRRRPPQDYKEEAANLKEETTENKIGDLIEDDDDDDDFEVNLVYEEEEISMSHLKEFEGTKKPKKKKKKQKPKLNNTATAGENQLINDLYTACKTGNTKKLDSLLHEIVTNSTLGSVTVEVSREPNSSNLPSNANQTSVNVTNDSNGDKRISTNSGDNKSVQSQQIEGQGSRTKDNGSESENSPTSDVPQVDNNKATSEERTNNSSKEVAGHDDNSSTLQSVSSILNSAVDVKGTTLLHVAAEAGQKLVLWKLLESGADPSVRNKRGQPPYVVSANKEIRNELRRFMAAFPEKYNYTTAQIPSPLTADMEEERASKVAEKKKAQRKARKGKLKVKHQEES